MGEKKVSTTMNQVRKLGSFVRKLGDEEINLFLVVLGALMAQVPAPRDARKSYLKEVEVRLRNNGADFLAKSRAFPTFGLKLLGNDRDGFPIQGFKQQSGKIYPALFAWYWSELERLSKVSKPNKADVLRVRRVLTVLSFAKMIKTSSVSQIRKALEGFEERVVMPKPEIPDYSELDIADFARNLVSAEEKYFNTCPSLKDALGCDVDLDTYPGYMDLGSVSTKPSALKESPAFPYWFEPQFSWGFQRTIMRMRGEDVDPPLFGFKPPPYGRVHVLTESAGKLRLIVPYNTPFAHSTGLYSRCRALMRETRGDYSENQAAGHRFVNEEMSRGNGLMNVSCDLSNFSDDISQEAIVFGLREIGLYDLESYLFELPISLPNGKVITPRKLLMGLKGCFELSSVLHHHCVRSAGISRYALVGDDLFFRGDINTYLSNLSSYGWKLNRSKTVISKTVAVFCGEMFWFGKRVSPRVPKVSSCFHDGKRRKASELFSVTRSGFLLLNEFYNRRSVATVMSPFVQLLRKSWKGIIYPTFPAKLRGLGAKPYRQGHGLLSALKRPAINRMACLSIGIARDRIPQHRWFGIPVELNPSEIQREFPDFPALLSEGAVSLDIPKPSKGRKKDISALDDLNVLEWYYDDVRLEPNQFGII